VLLVLLGLASVVWPVLGLPAAFAGFIGLVALPAPPPSALPRPRWWVVFGALAASVGLVRFVVTLAMPGIVGGGQRAVEQRAVSRLREVLFAQDALRRAGWIDPDADGVGSAAFLEELCGAAPRRGQQARATPVLHCGELVPTPLGLAAQSGAYLYTVCLPLQGGGWSATPGARVDDELAERRFLAYAWPAASTAGKFDEAFFIDEHENILVAALPAGVLPPACDAARGCLATRGPHRVSGRAGVAQGCGRLAQLSHCG
jgi:type II secretory pathway pseudopilin PulG